MADTARRDLTFTGDVVVLTRLGWENTTQNYHAFAYPFRFDQDGVAGMDPDFFIPEADFDAHLPEGWVNDSGVSVDRTFARVVDDAGPPIVYAIEPRE